MKNMYTIQNTHTDEMLHKHIILKLNLWWHIRCIYLGYKKLSSGLEKGFISYVTQSLSLLLVHFYGECFLYAIKCIAKINILKIL